MSPDANPAALPPGPADVDTGEEGVAPRDPDAAWEIGAGLVPDDAVEGAAALQEATDAGEVTT